MVVSHHGTEDLADGPQGAVVTELREKEARRRERKQAKADKATDGELFEADTT